MKKSLIISAIVIAAIVVVIVIIMKRPNTQTSTTNEETITLMGIEMTQEQAIEHCQVMPDMDGCAPYLK